MPHTTHGRARPDRLSQTRTVSGVSSLADFAAGKNLRHSLSMDGLGYSPEQASRLAGLLRAGGASSESPTTLLLFTGTQGAPRSMDRPRNPNAIGKFYTTEDPQEFIIEGCGSPPVERTAVGTGAPGAAARGVPPIITIVNPSPQVLRALRAHAARSLAVLVIDPMGDAAMARVVATRQARAEDASPASGTDAASLWGQPHQG